MNRPQNLPAAIKNPIPINVDFILHDEAHPFCDDMKCPCHSGATWDDIFYCNEYLEQPFDDGLLTVAEKHRLWEGRQV